MKIIKYFIDGVPYYLVDDVQYTKEEFEKKLFDKDRKEGHRDRTYGIYNEWFKKNRRDGGKAYDLGCKDAEREPNIAKIVVTVYV